MATPVICSTETNFLTNCRGDYINIKEIDPKKFFTNWIPLSQNTNIISNVNKEESSNGSTKENRATNKNSKKK